MKKETIAKLYFIFTSACTLPVPKRLWNFLPKEKIETWECVTTAMKIMTSPQISTICTHCGRKVLQTK